jgi:hypothetical protein
LLHTAADDFIPTPSHVVLSSDSLAFSEPCLKALSEHTGRCLLWCDFDATLNQVSDFFWKIRINSRDTSIQVLGIAPRSNEDLQHRQLIEFKQAAYSDFAHLQNLPVTHDAVNRT